MRCSYIFDDLDDMVTYISDEEFMNAVRHTAVLHALPSLPYANCATMHTAITRGLTVLPMLEWLVVPPHSVPIVCGFPRSR